jgi:hypothetical protein
MNKSRISYPGAYSKKGQAPASINDEATACVEPRFYCCGSAGWITSLPGQLEAVLEGKSPEVIEEGIDPRRDRLRAFPHPDVGMDRPGQHPGSVDFRGCCSARRDAPRHSCPRNRLPGDWELIDFSTDAPQEPCGKCLIDISRASRHKDWADRASAYLINSTGAKKLLDQAYPIGHNADGLTWRMDITGVVS